MSPRVSVVIPTYNRASMIGEAIDSVIAQSLADVEIIVVDDGSTDGTAEAMQAYGSRVTYVRTPHVHPAHARNVGYRLARGEYVTCLDSDDRLHPYALELQASLLDRHADVALVCAELSAFDDSGWREARYLQTYHASAYRHLAYDRIFGSGTALADVLDIPAAALAADAAVGGRRVYQGRIFDVYLLDLVVAQNTTMVRRRVLDAVGPRNEHLAHWYEVDLLLRICRQHAVCFVDVPTYAMRFHDGQISRTAGPAGRRVWVRKQRLLLHMVRRHALADPTYYERHRRRLDAGLAQLHRAVAVPLLLAADVPRRRLARRARAFLRGSRRCGQPEVMLWTLSFLPSSVRRLGVTIIEKIRQRRLGRPRHAREVAS